MPVLHTYRSREGHYVLAGVNGRIVTYRLSPEGASHLQDSGINDNDKFSWQLLLELIRNGEAYTSAAGVEEEDLSGWEQLGLLFSIPDNEPMNTDPVPLCSCGSMDGLHIVELAETKTAALLCRTCRTSRKEETDASVPVYVINTPAALERLLQRSGLTSDDTVTAYRDLLNLTLSAKWESKIQPKTKGTQGGLFDKPEDRQQTLL